MVMVPVEQRTALSPQHRAFMRRHQQRINPVPRRPLTAAAATINLRDKAMARELRIVRQGWQLEAAAYADILPELSFAYRFMAHASSRMRYFPAFVNPEEPDGPPIRATEYPQIPESVVEEMQRSMMSLGIGRQALSPIQKSLSYQFGITGECYLTGMDNQEEDETWKIRSIDEFQVYDDAYKLRETPTDPQGILGWIDLDPAHTYAARMWTPWWRFSQMATSPMRSLIDVSEELLLLSRDVRSVSRSRLAGAGIMKFPDGLRMGTMIEDNQDPEADDFVGRLTEAMMEPLADDGVASAVVPIVISGGADELAQLDHLLIDRPYSALAIELRAEAIGRMATGLDVPREVLEGMSDPNHWGAWLVSDDTFRHHIEPQVIQQVDAMTVAYLRPWLEAAGVEKFWVDRACIWYDPVDLISKPDPMANATQLHDRMVISDAALRNAGGFSEDDKPSTLEVEFRMLQKTRSFPPNMVEALFHAYDPQLEFPPIKVPGTIPGLSPSGEVGVEPPAPAPEPEPTPAETAPPPPPPAPVSAPAPAEPGMAAEPTVFGAGGNDMARLSRRLGELDAQLRGKIQVAACGAMLRALDKAGAKLRTKVSGKGFKDETVKALVAGVPNRMLPARLGPAVVASLGFAEGSSLVESDWGELRSQFTAWVSSAQDQALGVAAQIGRLSAEDDSLRDARERMSQSVDPAWAFFEQELNSIATGLLKQEGAEAISVDPNTVVPVGAVRRALAIAGGAKAPKAVTAAAGRPSLGYAEAAEYLGTTVGRLRRLVAGRQVAHLRIGNRVTFESADLDEFLERAKVQPVFAAGDPADAVAVDIPTVVGDDPDPAQVSVTLTSEAAGQIGTGSAITDMLSDTDGVDAVGFTWIHGPTMRPFEPHEDLDGTDFTSFTDDALANSGDWPENDYFFPGDHDGCSCDFSTTWGASTEAPADEEPEDTTEEPEPETPAATPSPGIDVKGIIKGITDRSPVEEAGERTVVDEGGEGDMGDDDEGEDEGGAGPTATPLLKTPPPSTPVKPTPKPGS